MKKVKLNNKRGRLYAEDVVLICILALLVIFVSLVIFCYVNDQNNQKQLYNNGIHQDCGGAWVYQEPVGHKYSTTYIFKCNKCGLIKEFSKSACGDVYVTDAETTQEATTATENHDK